jgi:hypothetical protein
MLVGRGRYGHVSLSSESLDKDDEDDDHSET